MRWLLLVLAVGSVNSLQRELRLDDEPGPPYETPSESGEQTMRESQVNSHYSQTEADDDRRREFYSIDPDDPNLNDSAEAHNHRARREAHAEGPREEHVRVKRCPCADEEPIGRSRRAADPDGTRRPRPIHQYEVYENTDDFAAPVPPYEQMLAASADHYHRVRPAPAAMYQDPVSSHLQSSPPNVRPSYPAVYVNPASESVARPVSYTGVWSAAAGDPVSAALVGPAGVPAEPVAAAAQLAGDHHQRATSHGHVAGGGKKDQAGHHHAHGGKSTKGFKTSHHSDEGNKGHKIDEKHRKEYEDVQGQKKKHHDHADHKGGHEEEAHGVRGAHFDEKKGHKKGHKTKGYHNKYHKDEFHKEHKFYDDFHKSGSHHRFGNFHAKHASNESGKKKAHHVDAGHDVKEHGKKGHSAKGHVDADHKGYKGGQGHEEHSHKHVGHGKQGGKQGGKHWGYQRGKQ